MLVGQLIDQTGAPVITGVPYPTPEIARAAATEIAASQAQMAAELQAGAPITWRAQYWLDQNKPIALTLAGVVLLLALRPRRR